MSVSSGNKESLEATKNLGEDEILKLIRLIDRNKNRMFKSFDAFRGLSVPFIALAMTYILVWIFLAFFPENLGIRLSIMLAFFSFVIGMLSLFRPFMGENIVDVNFRRLEKCVEEDERPLLKGLIKIKAKNTEFDLEQIYKMNPSMFSRERLLEILYD
jgi:hypothetical protein